MSGPAAISTSKAVMDITDFTRGIVTDIDPQDGSTAAGSVRNMENLDPWPGHTDKRKGTTAFSFIRDDDEPIPGPNEIVIQIRMAYVPTAKADAVKDFPPASIRCTNTDVTFVLVRHAVTGLYRIYHDGEEADVFKAAITPDGTGWIEGLPNEVPFMIPRISAVAIGNIKTIDPATGAWDEPGVLWFGHIRRLACWTYNDVADVFEYMAAIDEWRLSNAECYDAAGEITCRAVVSNYAALWNANDSADHPFYQQYTIPGTDPPVFYDAITVLDEGIGRFMLGSEARKFNLKVTAMYDGYQESRPLQWQHPVYDTIEIKDEVNINGTVYGEKTLPTGWELLSDAENNQHLRVEIDPTNIHSIAGFLRNADPWQYPRDDHFGIPPALAAFLWRLEMRWNQSWKPDEYAALSGEGFSVAVYWSQTGGPAADGELDVAYELLNDGGPSTFSGINILVRGENARAIVSPAIIMFLLGKQPPSIEVVNSNVANTTSHERTYWEFIAKWYRITSWKEWRKCRELFTIIYEEYGYDGDIYGGPANPYFPISYNYVAFGLLSWIFKVDERVGIGLFQVQPVVPRKLVAEAADSTALELFTGSRRLSGFRVYVKEDEVDVDYRLISDIQLDYNIGDVDHGGTEEDPEDIIIGYRDGTFTGTSPSFHDDGTTVYPYLKSQQHFGPPLGGANRKFLITDDLLTDREGLSLLSANMMRDERKRDAPVWKRGAVCNGRLYGIGYGGEIDYCLMAGGVMQYDIKQGSFHVSAGEEITHIVSWRAQHHMIFTDKNLWRLSLGDGDELSWSVLDSFVHQGTRLWQAIVDTPLGLIYPNENGIWLYDGNRPDSAIRDKWEKHYLATYPTNVGEEVTFGAYDPSIRQAHFMLTDNASYPEVWVFNLRTGAWRKYRYADGKRPGYMTMHRAKFLQAFGAQDLREWDAFSHTDLGLAFGGFLITQEVPPIDQTNMSYWQYMGIRFISPTDEPMAIRVHYEPYDNYVLWNTGKTIVIPTTRREYFFPLPLGISRNMRIMIGQGGHFGMAESEQGFTISSISFRGAQHPQWSGTR